MTLQSAYSVTGTVLSSLQLVTHLIFMTVRQEKYYYCYPNLIKHPEIEKLSYLLGYYVSKLRRCIRNKEHETRSESQNRNALVSWQLLRSLSTWLFLRSRVIVGLMDEIEDLSVSSILSLNEIYPLECKFPMRVWCVYTNAKHLFWVFCVSAAEESGYLDMAHKSL